MPKMKSKSAVKKRFKVTATGKIKHHRSGHNHNLTKKNAKRKRTLRKDKAMENTTIQKNLLTLLGR